LGDGGSEQVHQSMIFALAESVEEGFCHDQKSACFQSRPGSAHLRIT
jgi:hypothetical protein